MNNIQYPIILDLSYSTMAIDSGIHTARFGQLNLAKGPENDFVWSGVIDVETSVFTGQMPIYIFTKKQNIPVGTIDFAEKIISAIDEYLKKSILFIKQTLTAQKEEYKIQKNEYEFLSLDHLSLNLPELTFWEDSTEWLMRFTEGKFDICDPYGISVTYNGTTPISVNNLEDSEMI